jgi:hypothetical protein
MRVWAHARAVRFAVTDQGPGVAEDQLAHVFNRYRQGTAEARHGFGRRRTELDVTSPTGIPARRCRRYFVSTWMASDPTTTVGADL